MTKLLRYGILFRKYLKIESLNFVYPTYGRYFLIKKLEDFYSEKVVANGFHKKKHTWRLPVI